MVLGKHSGRNAFRSRLEELGTMFGSEEELNEVVRTVQGVGGQEARDLRRRSAGHRQRYHQPRAEYERIRLVSLKVCSETGETPHADVVVSVDGEEKAVSAAGGGPGGRGIQGHRVRVGSRSTLQLYSVNNITSGTDAQGEVTVRLEKGSRIVNGQGADTDIVIASAKAYINGLNKLFFTVQRAHPQTGDV